MAYNGTLRDLLPGSLGNVASEVLTFTDALIWSGATVHSGAFTPTGAFNISGATVTYRAILNADLSASAAIARSKLAQDDLKVFPIQLSSWRQADQAVMGISGTTGDHFYDVATSVHSLKGNTPSSGTVTDISVIQVILPAEYVDGETIEFRVAAKVDTAADTNTLDLECRKANSTTGAVGSDINATTIKTTTASAQLFTFTITPTGLVAGDRLNFILTTVNQDSDGSDGIVDIFSTDLLCDVKG